MKARSAEDDLVRVQATTDYRLQRLEDEWVVAHFADSRLSSVFQPVVSSALQVIGHAAFIRCEPDNKNIVSPWDIFSLATEDSALVRLDRLCRTVHALNYFGAASGPGNLFVSVQPRLLESVKDDHGNAFAKVLDLIGIPASRVVIEIPGEVNRNWKLLAHVIGNYRSRGYRIAANHSGTGNNWMAELGSLYPDIVRLEAWTLAGCYGTKALLDSIHHFGASVLVHEIETVQHKDTALQEGADLLQGRALGMPVRGIEAAIPGLRRTQYRESPGDHRRPSFRGTLD
ncbi:EAL domain-containing protein [Nitrosospira sp. Is2]|uniref:EAL domain-containing protein n=1 Tax=Nitrosospira sp. Is2 TaxID=3080532 RepID=UPI0029554407|nr:EAL domain-containing protein [Nitrosospira sp. Is2]WON74871.1 EAL domain-containing protein [Nitrosospira sp. Is2]